MNSDEEHFKGFSNVEVGSVTEFPMKVAKKLV